MGEFLVRQGEHERGLAMLSRALELSHTPMAKAASLAVLAEVYRSVGDDTSANSTLRQYIALVAAHSDSLSDAEQGLSALFQGDIFLAEKQDDQAYSQYERAHALVSENYRRAEISMKMAEIQARRNNRPEAAALAERSAAELPDAWKFRQAGDFLMGLDMPEQAFVYYERFAALSDSAQDTASVYATMADAAKDQDEQEQYLRFAAGYVAAVESADHALTDVEKGLSAFYQGEIALARGENEAASTAYEQALKFLSDQNKLSDAYWHMATIQSARGNVERAAEYAEQSAAARPEAWKFEQVGNFLLGINQPQRAFRYFQQYVQATSAGDAGTAAVHAIMANAYKDAGDRARYLESAQSYIDAVTAGGRTPTRDEQGLAAFYQGEILAARNQPDAAYREYAAAAELTSDMFLRSDIYLQMAQYHADRKERDQAIVFADKAAAAVPAEDWKLQQIGEFYDRNSMPEKALDYYRLILPITDSAKTRAATYSAIAEIYSKMDDQEQYRANAAEYIAIIASGEFTPTRDEDGLRYFYQGDIETARDNADAAYQAYERASQLVTDKYRLSNIYIRMARYQVAKGNKELAVDFADRSYSLIPDQGWRVMEVGDIYNTLELTDKAIEYYELAAELSTGIDKPTAAYTALAEVYKKLGNQQRYIEYAALYVQAMAERQGELSDNEQAQVAFYQGEIADHAGNHDQAYAYYEQAARLSTDRFRLSDIAMKQAEYHAKAGRREVAGEFAEKSAALLPDQAWRQLGTGEFFSNLEMMDKAVEYFQRALDLSKTPETRASALSALAGAYKKMENEQMYIATIREYIAAIDAKTDELTRAELALRWYYLGEIYSAEKNEGAAYAAYETATVYIEDRYRLSDVYMTLAKYNLKIGNKPLAAEQAINAADLLPDQDWRIGDAVSVLGDAGYDQEAVALVQRAIRLDRPGNMRLFQNISQMYARAKDRKKQLFYNACFIDLLSEQVELKGGRAAPRELRQELWDARTYQNGVGRVWGLDSYYFGKRWSDGNYFLGMSHELFRYYSLPNGLGGKMYMNYGGTIKGLYSGQFISQGIDIQRWESRPRFPETVTAVFGININPFRNVVLNSMSLGLEYLVGLGSDTENDFRFRIGYDKTVGDRPRPFGNVWKYWKAYKSTVYSTRNNDIVSAGEFRLGLTMVGERDRNLMFMPHLDVIYNYGGKTVDKGARWGFDIGPGIAVRKWFREDKYNTPRSYVDLQIYYHFALTHDRKDGIGFTLSTSF